MEKVPKFNKRRTFIKDVGSGKKSKIDNVGPTFYPDYRVGELDMWYLLQGELFY
jgi:hypothetical protein